MKDSAYIIKNFFDSTAIAAIGSINDKIILRKANAAANWKKLVLQSL